MKDPRYPYALEIGSEIGGYRIEAVLGAGGFGITYRATNDVTQKTVAIKEFYIRDISSRTGATVLVDTEISAGTYDFALKKFQEEAQVVVTRFQHPYVIRGENFVKQNNTSYLIMEYVEGLNLEEWLTARGEPPSEAQLRRLFEKVFEAVDYVHSRNTMHRDLTPRNIMIRTNGEPVLIDFGAAGHGIDRDRSSRMVAQMRYAPPEQIDEDGSGIHGRYTDIFSLGGVLYRAVTGRAPTAPMTRVARLGRRDSGGIDPHVPAREAVLDPSKYSPRFLDGIDAALQIDERDRPQSIAEFRRALGWAEDAEADDHADVTVMMPPRADDHTVLMAQDDGTRFVGPGDEPTSLAGGPADPSDAPAPMVSPFVSAAGGGRTATGPSRTDPSRTGAREQVSGVQAPSPAGSPVARSTAAPTAAPGLLAEAPAPRRLPIGRLATAAAVIALLGGGFVAAPQIRGLLGGASSQVVSPFVLAASIDGNKVTLSGHVPSEADRAMLVDVAGRGIQGLALDDRLAVGAGAPTRFAEMAKTVLIRLGDLSKGRVELSDNRARIEGTSITPEAEAAMRRAFDTPGAEGLQVELALSPAVASPYRFTVERGRDRLRLTGYVPDPATRTRLVAAARKAAPGGTVDADLLPAAGAPPGFADQATALLPVVSELAEGASAQLDGRRWRISGLAPSPEVQARLSTVVADGLPGGGVAEFTVTAPPVSPFDWAAQIDDTAIVITGHIPNAAAKQGLAATAAHLWPDRRIDDRTVVADGAAPGFAAAAGIALGDLAALARGRVSLVDRAFTIEGTARTPEAYAAIGRSLAGLPAGYSTSDAKLEPPVASPYLSAIKVEGGEMTLAGYMPSEAARAEILANTGKTFPGRVTDGTTVAAGAPEGFPAAVAWGVGIAGRLTQAEISLRDAAISVTGKVKALDDIPALRGLAAAPPAGFTIASTAIGGRTDVAATDCDRLALPPSHPDRPQGAAGVALDAIDVAAALPTCEAALAAAPDVRRFATALATVKLKQGDAKAAAALLASASAADDPTATARLAALKRDGLDGPADPKAAAMLAARAADAGDPLGMTVLAGLVEQGLGVPVDRARAADLYGRAAARGDLDALTALARLTEIGAAGPADPAKARDLYARAARGGSPFAMHALGRMLDKGLGGSADATEALDWYRRAADAGRPESMVAAGLMLAEGRGRPADAHAAGALFEKAAALGEPAAMYELGLQALDGRGRPKSEAIAVQWFERAAALGLPEAMGRLGFVALAGIGPGTGASPDFARARLWFVAGTKAGDPLSHYGLGVMAEAGLGQDADRVAALRNYQVAAAAGLPVAMVRLGLMAEVGIGRAPDLAAAADWYRKAAEAGDVDAALRLGLLLARDRGDSGRVAEARRWLEQAASRGSAAAAWNAAVLIDQSRAEADAPRAADLLLAAFAADEPNTVDALSGDMSGFTDATRRALIVRLKAHGSLAADAAERWDEAARRAVIAEVRRKDS